jgi:hypothetical protein
VNPARFLVGCEQGHLDDFPWLAFVHRAVASCPGPLRFSETGASGEAADVFVSCDACNARRPMVDAFGESGNESLPACRGRRPHLRDYSEGCKTTPRAILLGASNSWFPIVLSALSIPTASGKLAQLVEDHWAILEKAVSPAVLLAFRQVGNLPAFAQYTDDEIWKEIEARRHGGTESGDTDLKTPEWRLLTEVDPSRNTSDFRVRDVGAPPGYDHRISRVVLVERLREVRALIGFTRIQSPGDFGDEAYTAPDRRAPLSRTPPGWLPAHEVRGEGLFVQFDEERMRAWLESHPRKAADTAFLEAHRAWRHARRLDPVDAGFPGLRFVLLHTFAHAVMRQLALECGYTAASIRERIYCAERDEASEPMAGVLLYTAAADSEGTLGGLVSLGEPAAFSRLLEQALAHAAQCASDPLCAEHRPWRDGQTLHGAACHACLFSPETSCERGNHYLDRSVLTETVESGELAFFGRRQ